MKIGPQKAFLIIDLDTTELAIVFQEEDDIRIRSFSILWFQNGKEICKDKEQLLDCMKKDAVKTKVSHSHCCQIWLVGGVLSYDINEKVHYGDKLRIRLPQPPT